MGDHTSVRSLGTRLTNGCDLSCTCLEQNLGLLKETLILLNIEHVFSPEFFIFINPPPGVIHVGDSQTYLSNCK